jgi:hypothetical protein
MGKTQVWFSETGSGEADIVIVLDLDPAMLACGAQRTNIAVPPTVFVADVRRRYSNIPYHLIAQIVFRTINAIGRNLAHSIYNRVRKT